MLHHAMQAGSNPLGIDRKEVGWHSLSPFTTPWPWMTIKTSSDGLMWYVLLRQSEAISLVLGELELHHVRSYALLSSISVHGCIASVFRGSSLLQFTSATYTSGYDSTNNRTSTDGGSFVLRNSGCRGSARHGSPDTTSHSRYDIFYLYPDVS